MKFMLKMPATATGLLWDREEAEGMIAMLASAKPVMVDDLGKLYIAHVCVSPVLVMVDDSRVMKEDENVR